MECLPFLIDNSLTWYNNPYSEIILVWCMFWLTRNRLTLFNHSILTNIYQIRSQLWNSRNLSTLLPLLSIYLLILTVLEIAQRCHVTRMSCSIANAHYALLKAIFPHFNICVDSHKDILCLCDIWTCSLYWKMDNNSPDKCFFLGVFSFNLEHCKFLPSLSLLLVLYFSLNT